jgi:hypothetical protein
MEFVSPVWGDVGLSVERDSMCASGGKVGQFDCSPKWYEMKWEMEIVMAAVKGRRWGGWRAITWRGIETDAVYSSDFESVISNPILWWISVINELCVCVRACVER